LNHLLASIHGRYGGVVFVYRRGRQHMRPYVKPRNPDTLAQRSRRDAFREAVHAWQAMPADEKERWNSLAVSRPLSGYNAFISHVLHRGGMTPRGQVTSSGDGSGRHRDCAALPSPLLRFAVLTASIHPLPRSRHAIHASYRVPPPSG